MGPGSASPHPCGRPPSCAGSRILSTCGSRVKGQFPLAGSTFLSEAAPGVESTIGARRFSCPSTLSSSTRGIAGSASEATSGSTISASGSRCPSTPSSTPRAIAGCASEATSVSRTSVRWSKCPSTPFSTPRRIAGSATEGSSASTIGARGFGCPSTASSSTGGIAGCATEDSSASTIGARGFGCPSTPFSSPWGIAGGASEASDAPAIAVLRSDDPWGARLATCPSSGGEPPTLCARPTAVAWAGPQRSPVPVMIGCSP